MRIERLNKNNEESWKKFIEKNPDSRIQHSLEWKGAIEETYKNCKPFYYIIYDNKNKVKAVFPFFLVKSKIFGNRLISQPFIDNGGFIGEINYDSLIKLIKWIKENLGNLRFIQIRINSHMSNYKALKTYLIKAGFREELKRYQFVLELEATEKLWKKLSKNARRMIKYGKKNKLYVKEIKIGEELDLFYQLYLKNMKSFGTPPHSKKFFCNLWKKLYDNRMIKGLNCYKDNKMIGSMICYLASNYIYYIYSVSDKRNLKFYPNDFLYWNFIKWSVENDYKWFDFGQVEITAEEGSHAYGLYKFKKKWGGSLYKRPYFYYYFDKKGDRDTKKKYKKFTKIWGKLPLFIVKRIGPKLCSELGL